MSKIYEALEQARRELQQVRQPVDGAVTELPHETSADKQLEQQITARPVPPPVPVTGELNLEKEMTALYQTINSLLPDVTHRVIQFVSARQGEGTSTIVRELARVATTVMGRSVLLLDIDRTNGEARRFSGSASPPYIDEVVKGNSPVDQAICRIEDTTLFVSPLFQHSVLTPQKLGSDSTDQLWQQLRERFDYVLIDSPPVSLSSDALAIVRKADGVIFVVEAEKTRWTVAQAAKGKIVSHGGNLLGMVFDKRKFYIPEAIYRKL